ncbi:MAG: isoleucine--tRNA ligase [Gammaproteobacteria bacterium]|nr:isoleucine--tRNA ligase [Gammaproteobacteria bacterium]
MSDYKNTLNLPKTDFPMKANLPKREPEILAYWQDIKLYEQLRTVGKDRKKFILHDGPPYANGQIHIGHAINKTLKDIVVKSKTLSNYDSPYVPGWDCHGLPIELNVEKNIVKLGQVSTEEFIKACRKYASSQVELQKADFIRLGVIGDWEHPYLTMDPTYEANTIRSLAKIIANGHLQQGHKPVHWCTECGSALAEAEVEYKDKQSFAIDVLFRVVNNKEVVEKLNLTLSDPEFAVPIWTTTPWTLPANQAVALNPSHAYVWIQVLDRMSPLLLVAEELLPSFVQRLGITEHQVVAGCLGSDLEGVRLHHPFLMREVPVVLGDHVTLDTGSGAVHTAPAHGQEDYVVGQKYRLPMDNPVDAKGLFVPGTPFFAGEHVFKVNPHVIQVIQDNQNLLHDTKMMHSYAHCWRHKTPLIYRATPQWFISMEKNGLREQALAAINKTGWIPDWGQMRIADMVQKRPDWCISRQRVWNTPIPLFVHKHTGELHPDTLEIMEKVAVQVAEKGIEVWQQLTLQDVSSGNSDDYDKITDTLDVWFDSGVSHESVLNHNPELHSPADLYLEGSDQHRGWFQTSLLTSVAMYGRAPFHTVLTHGFTVDAEGKKMSKSIGNVIAPEKVINKLGADVLRLWIATTDYRGEMSVSEEILERSSEAYRRIRNTVRFFLSNLDDFNPKEDAVPASEMLSLDQWAVDAAAELQEEIITAYANYQFHQVSQRIHHFCTVEMGSFYLDILKDRLYTTKATSLARRSAQTAIYHILQAMVRWIAPILSFTAEEIWQYLPGEKQDSVFLTTWYTDLVRISPAERQKWQRVIVVREQINQELERQRNEGNIGSPLAADVELYCTEELQHFLAQFGSELRFIFITSEANVYPLENEESLDEAVVTISSQQAMKILIKPSNHEKCQRCWHRREDVGASLDYPEICQRCIDNVVGEGEKRLFA